MPEPRKKNRKVSGNGRKRDLDGRWPKGVSGNPGGRPKCGESWAEIIRFVGALTPVEAAQWAASIAKRLRPVGDKVTLKEAAVLSAYAGTIFDPSASVLNFLADRDEGKLPTRHIVGGDWRAEARSKGKDPDKLLEDVVAEVVERVTRLSEE